MEGQLIELSTTGAMWKCHSQPQRDKKAKKEEGTTEDRARRTSVAAQLFYTRAMCLRFRHTAQWVRRTRILIICLRTPETLHKNTTIIAHVVLASTSRAVTTAPQTSRFIGS